MTPRNSTTGWNPPAGSNFTHHPQTHNESQSRSEEGLDGETPEDFYKERVEYFRTQYDVMTGLRIAATLGGFFLLVLITLLYKSKCKKSSREGTPTGERMDPASHDLALLSTNILPINQIPSSFGRGPKSRIECDFEEEPSGFLLMTPQVLLTQPNDSSQSSNESELSLSSFRGRESSISSSGGLIGPPPNQPGPSRPRAKIRKKRKLSSQMSRLEQNIDIHVIQPTPTISPSGSATFQPARPLPVRKIPRDLTMHRASDSDAAAVSLFNNNSGTTAPPPGASVSNPLFFLHAENLNLRYMDDTSSENIPTRASDMEEDECADIQSLGSDSVFNFQPRVEDEFEDQEYVDGDGDGDQCRITLTEAHAQVHHRDSYCSGESSLFESVNDYLESHRRRSSSTQTTISDLRQFMGLTLPIPVPVPLNTKSDLSISPASTLSPSLNGKTLSRDPSPTCTRKSELHLTTNSNVPSTSPSRETMILSPTSPSPPESSHMLNLSATNANHPPKKKPNDPSHPNEKLLTTASSNQTLHDSVGQK